MSRIIRRSLAMVFLAALGAGSLATAGDDGPPTDAPSPWRARALDLEGLEWRRDLHRGLDQVGNRGAASIWTADPGALGRLLAQARTVRDVEIGDNLDRATTHNFVGHLDRMANGPVDQSTSLAFGPRGSDPRRPVPRRDDPYRR